MSGIKLPLAAHLLTAHPANAAAATPAPAPHIVMTAMKPDAQAAAPSSPAPAQAAPSATPAPVPGVVVDPRRKVSPYDLASLRAAADAWFAAHGGVPYLVITYRPTEDKSDAIVHSEPFDVNASSPAPASAIFATDADAKAAAIMRAAQLEAAVRAGGLPYVYVATYGQSVAPHRMTELYLPPAPQAKSALVPALIATLGATGLAIFAGRKHTKKGAR